VNAPTLSLRRALREHWPEYLMEAWGLGTFMVSAGIFGALLEYPGSPLHQALPDPVVRRVLMGLAMGLTAIAIIYSPWGKRSGAHINPAVTLGFLSLGRVHRVDAIFYILAQFAGGLLGVLLVWGMLGEAFALPPVDFVNTLPGAYGTAAAFLTETAMAFSLMLIVVCALGTGRLMPLVGIIAGMTVAGFIALLAPISGMSINPARSFASAAPSGNWRFLWLYFTAPVLGMLAAVEVFRLGNLGRERICAKLNHHRAYRCIHCSYEPAQDGRKHA